MSENSPEIRWARKNEIERRCTVCRHATVDGPPGRPRMYCYRHDQEVGPIYTCDAFEKDGEAA